MADTVAPRSVGPHDDFYKPLDRPPFLLTLGLGAQHVFAMFGATVLGPILMGFDPNLAILFSGVATITFFVIVGGRVPSYLGSSFAFIAAVGAATGYSGTGPNPNVAVALGGIIAAGILYMLIGAFASGERYRYINRAFPPTLSGVIVAIIGLNLASVAIGQIGTEPVGAAIALATTALAAFVAVYGTVLLRRFAILVSALIGYTGYAILGNGLGLIAPINFAPVLNAAWIGVPSFVTPVFDTAAIWLIAPVAFILVAENLGHIKAIGGMTGENLDPYIGRAFIADGFATVLSASGGGTGVTTYAENMGVMRITGNFASITFVAAGAIAICLGLCPKFGAAIMTIPAPVLGGLSLVMFGLITATAGLIWQRGVTEGSVDFAETRTILSVGIGLVIGAGNLTFTVGKLALGGIVTATFFSFLLFHLLGLRRRRTDFEA